MRVSGALASTRRIAHVSLVCAHILDACESESCVYQRGVYTCVGVQARAQEYECVHKDT